MPESLEHAQVRPQEGPQERALACSADILIFGGQAGGGKTFALLLEALRHSNNRYFTSVIFRRTYPQIAHPGGLWDTSIELYGNIPGAVPLEGPPPRWGFRGGYKLTFSHLQHAQDRLHWKGAQVGLLGFDQLEEFTSGQFWYLLSRNRSTTGIRPYVRATCNPIPEDDEVGGWLHDLVTWWIDQDSGLPIPERDGVIRWFNRIDDDLIWADRPQDLPKPEFGKSLTFIRSRLEDNPALIAKDPGYEANLEALPLVDRERLREGNWKVRPSAGKVFDRGWFPIVAAAPAQAKRVRYWDKAATEGGGAYTAGVRIAYKGGIFYIEDVVRGQWSAGHRDQVMQQVAEADGRGVEIWVEQEPGSGGKESAQASVKQLAGFAVRADRVTGDKVERAKPMSAQAEAGNVVLVQGDWHEVFLHEAHTFPDSKYKDQVDAAAGAVNKLVLSTRSSGRGAKVTI